MKLSLIPPFSKLRIPTLFSLNFTVFELLYSCLSLPVLLEASVGVRYRICEGKWYIHCLGTSLVLTAR